ncbi:MAG: divalent metal cation transporter [Chloroflexi bacterium]|nr:divalent metal cation transporter [Chloroflexota bacterium]
MASAVTALPARLLRAFDLRLVRASREARKGVHELGPGIITGVADDDPSGIATYSLAGANHGYSLLWLSLVTFPMNFAVQSICARIGLVSGRGLAGVIGQHYGRRWLYPVVVLLLVANTVNIGADIAAIAAGIDLITPIPAALMVVPVGVAIALVEIVMPYARFAAYLKVLTLVVFAYVVGAFVAGPDWGEALRGTTVPDVTFDRGLVATVVAILGTTISPYLFFWQASEEVEEEERLGIVAPQPGNTEVRALLRASRFDVGFGMLMANVGFYFVVLTTAATLFASGAEITSARDAAEALRPLAGDSATLLFAVGFIGTGLLAVPVLAGSGAYAVSELFDWPKGLNRTFRRAPQFYGVIALATIVGIGLNFSPLGEIEALYFAAILNGVIAPVILAFIMLAARDRRILGENVAGRPAVVFGWITTVAMAAASLVMFATLVW